MSSEESRNSGTHCKPTRGDWKEKREATHDRGDSCTCRVYAGAPLAHSSVRLKRAFCSAAAAADRCFSRFFSSSFRSLCTTTFLRDPNHVMCSTNHVRNATARTNVPLVALLTRKQG